jgi:hypothetical protein
MAQDQTKHKNISKLHFSEPPSPHQTIVPADLCNKRFAMKYKKELKAISNTVKSVRPTLPHISLFSLYAVGI